MKKLFFLFLVFGFVLVVLSLGCVIMVGVIIGGFLVLIIYEFIYLVIYEQLYRLSYCIEVIVYIIEGFIFFGKYVGFNFLNIDVFLFGVIIKMRDNVIIILWGNIERVEVKEIDMDKGVFFGIVIGVVIDVVVFILIMKNWGFEFSLDWDGF